MTLFSHLASAADESCDKPTTPTQSGVSEINHKSDVEQDKDIVSRVQKVFEDQLQLQELKFYVERLVPNDDDSNSEDFLVVETAPGDPNFLTTPEGAKGILEALMGFNCSDVACTMLNTFDVACTMLNTFIDKRIKASRLVEYYGITGDYVVEQYVRWQRNVRWQRKNASVYSLLKLEFLFYKIYDEEAFNAYYHYFINKYDLFEGEKDMTVKLSRIQLAALF